MHVQSLLPLHTQLCLQAEPTAMCESPRAAVTLIKNILHRKQSNRANLACESGMHSPCHDVDTHQKQRANDKKTLKLEQRPLVAPTSLGYINKTVTVHTMLSLLLAQHPSRSQPSRKCFHSTTLAHCLECFRP